MNPCGLVAWTLVPLTHTFPNASLPFRSRARVKLAGMLPSQLTGWPLTTAPVTTRTNAGVVKDRPRVATFLASHSGMSLTSTLPSRSLSTPSSPTSVTAAGKHTNWALQPCAARHCPHGTPHPLSPHCLLAQFGTQGPATHAPALLHTCP